jgi:hypothetical protein
LRAGKFVARQIGRLEPDFARRPDPQQRLVEQSFERTGRSARQIYSIERSFGRREGLPRCVRTRGIRMRPYRIIRRKRIPRKQHALL